MLFRSQIGLLELYQRRFARLGLQVAQVLLTRTGLEDRERFLNARHTLLELLRMGVVPIVNENDTVSIEELAVGDNDNLAASTAALVDAHLLALLTDVPGVLSADPEEDPAAAVIAEAASADELRALCFRKRAPESKGGMVTKLEAAERAGRFGIDTVIASGRDEKSLRAVIREIGRAHV